MNNAKKYITEYFSTDDTISNEMTFDDILNLLKVPKEILMNFSFANKNEMHIPGKNIGIKLINLFNGNKDGFWFDTKNNKSLTIDEVKDRF